MTAVFHPAFVDSLPDDVRQNAARTRANAARNGALPPSSAALAPSGLSPSGSQAEPPAANADYPEPCPVCSGDCSAANPPVIFCPMEARND